MTTITGTSFTTVQDKLDTFKKLTALLESYLCTPDTAEHKTEMLAILKDAGFEVVS